MKKIQYKEGDVINGITLIKDLSVIQSDISRIKKHRGIFKCPYCGKEFMTQFALLKSGHTSSCGCAKSNKISISKIKHGIAHTRIYTIWRSMVRRCCDTHNFDMNSHEYRNYYSRGITICDEWKNDCITFYNWAIANGYSNTLEIDRINNDGNYEPSNCRWVTKSENMQNKGMSKKNTSGYMGVSFSKDRKRYRAYSKINNKTIYLGSFKEINDAALAYNNFVVKNKKIYTLNIIKTTS